MITDAVGVNRHCSLILDDGLGDYHDSVKLAAFIGIHEIADELRKLDTMGVEGVMGVGHETTIPQETDDWPYVVIPRCQYRKLECFSNELHHASFRIVSDDEPPLKVGDRQLVQLSGAMLLDFGLNFWAREIISQLSD